MPLEFQPVQGEQKSTPPKDFYKNLYSKMDADIRIYLDALDGIRSFVVEDKSKYPTGVAFVRDGTTKALLPLNQRLPRNGMEILAPNMLLRALSTMRGIDHVLAIRGLHHVRHKLLATFQNLLNEVNKPNKDGIKKPKEHLKKLNKAFNVELIKILHQNGLDEGIKTAKDYEELLCIIVIFRHSSNLPNQL